MVANKHISKIVVAVMAVAVILCLLAVIFSDKITSAMGGTGISMEYEKKLFNTDEIITVDIQMDEADWNKMLSNATAEEYYVCDVVINGEKISNVAIRPKGNTSLSAIATDPDTDRYSLKLEFDHFDESQTCYGLDKLILNNNYADATNMKEAIIYDMYQYLDADASLYNYAQVSVNGEYWGVYLALEAVEESFQLRNYGTQNGELYKPDSMDMGGMGGNSSSSSSSSGFSKGDFSFNSDSIPSNNMPSTGGAGNGSGMPDMSNFNPGNGSGMPDMSNFNPGNGSGMPDMSNFNQGGNTGSSAGGFSMGGGGANLNYTDDSLDSYSTIWEGSVNDTTDSDHRRVVTALENISKGTDLEKYLDVDNILKYMAVHTFAVNSDSLSGSMAHNYYLYESDGQLNMIPWDYNLSLGGMSMGNSSSATEVVNDAIDTPFSGTKFFNALLENEEYLERYHQYLQQLVDEYIKGGRFDEVYNRIRGQIDSLVETDPTAFYTYEEYKNAASILYEVVELRGESIDGQIKGTIPSTDSGQSQNSSALIDASHLDITAMGQFNMGGGGGGFSMGGRTSSSESSSTGSGASAGFSRGDFSSLSGGKPDSGSGSFDMSSFSGMSSRGGSQSGINNNILLAVCFILMLLVLIPISFYKRRRYKHKTK